MTFELFGYTLDLKIIGLLLIMVGFLFYVISAVYNLIFKVRRLKREYKILEDEGMLDPAYTTSLDETLKKYHETGEVPKKVKPEPKKKTKKEEPQKPVRYADVDPGTGILTEDSKEYATSVLDLPQGTTVPEAYREVKQQMEQDDFEDANDNTSLMESDDRTSIM